MKNLLMIAGLLLCTSAARSQSTAPTADRQAVNATASTQARLLTTELGLNEKQAAQAQELLMRAEKEVAPLRAQCERIQVQVDAAYEPYYRQLSSTLTPEQNEKLALLKRSGKLSAGCGMSSAGCGHGKAEVKGSGCCAGGKASSSATPATKGKASMTQTRLK